MYFGPPCYGYVLNCHLVLFGHTSETSVIYEKSKCVCFIYMQLQKSEIHICSNKYEAGFKISFEQHNAQSNFTFKLCLKI